MSVRVMDASEPGNVVVDLADPFVGAQLSDRFRIDAKLGAGGYGYVYAGTQLGVDRKVAIKLLRPELCTDEEVTARFMREGLVMCKLRSEHTVTTYDVGRAEDGTMYIVMELLEGRSLKEIIRKESPLRWRRVLDILQQICVALAEAHECGIVHRDLKPANIQVEQRSGKADFIKVLDFGIAKIVEGGRLGMNTVPQLTAKGQTVGTLRYMSPEQLRGHELDGRSDIYTTGVLAYQLLTGQVPFPRAKMPVDLITAQLRSTPDAPSSVQRDAGIPARVDQLLAQMLDKDPEKRPEDAQAVRRICQEILDGEQDQPARERPATDGAATRSDVAPDVGPTEAIGVSPEASGRSIPLLTLIGAVLVVIAVVFALLVR